MRNRSVDLAKECREKRTNLESKVKKFPSMNELSIDKTVEYEMQSKSWTEFMTI